MKFVIEPAVDMDNYFRWKMVTGSGYVAYSPTVFATVEEARGHIDRTKKTLPGTRSAPVELEIKENQCT